MKIEIWYTIERNNEGYTVWMNKSARDNQHGSYGSYGLYTSKKKKDCIAYCKEKGIKYEKNK